MQDHIAGSLTNHNSLKVRKDSYTDKNAGVKYVYIIYIHQLVTGLQVADGAFNIDVKFSVLFS